MQKLFVHITGSPAFLAMAPDIGAPPMVGDVVRTLPGNRKFTVATITSTGQSDPLFQKLYAGSAV